MRAVLALPLILAVAIAAAVLWAGSAPRGDGARGDASRVTVPANAATIAGQLALIAADYPAYDSDAFGDRWADIDGNGCTRRQDVLVRDLVDEVLADDGCVVLTGVLDDPYLGELVVFAHDRVAAPGEPGSEGVQIDHVVSKAAAWRGGAWAWTLEERELWANDPDVLLATSGAVNQSKSDKGPAQWMPPHADYRCAYAWKYTEIATEWRIAVPVADRDALVDTLRRCV